MKKVLVLVEGATEESFIKMVLRPALPGLWLVPTVVRTRMSGVGPVRGGQVKYHEFRRQLHLLLGDSSAERVTTMVDYQGLGSDFPGRGEPRGDSPPARAEFVEAAMRAEVNNPRYDPFVTLHEFEALLFAQPATIARVLRQQVLAKPLEEIRATFPATPEDINDSPATSPSARIVSACQEFCGSPKIFQKRTHGPIIAARIGLASLRKDGPHFSGWVSRLEAVAAA